MIPRVIQVATVVSLVLCLLATALWIRSCYATDSLVIRLSEGGTQTSIYLSGGSFTTFTDYAEYIADDGGGMWLYQSHPATSDMYAIYASMSPRFEGFGLIVLPRHRDGGNGGVLVRYWLAVLATAILPAIGAIHRLRRRQSLGPGQCAICGYDLRATPDRCPECGARRP